jgi:hypothetical protein
MRKVNNISTLIPIILAFSILKLNGNIDWSWWIILSPIWISAIFVFVVLVSIGIVMAQDESIYNKWEDDEYSDN